MARSALRDPLTKYRWVVSIEGFTRLGFTECTTPSYSITTRTYREGGAHLTPKQIVNQIEYQPVTLRRGVTNDTSFNKWANGFIDLVTSNTALNNDSGQDESGSSFLGAVQDVAETVQSTLSSSAIPSVISGDNTSYRKDVTISHVNRAGQIEVSYILYGAFPIEYKPASDFNAMGDDGMSLDSITLAYDSFEVKYSQLGGLAGNIGADILI